MSTYKTWFLYLAQIPFEPSKQTYKIIKKSEHENLGLNNKKFQTIKRTDELIKSNSRIEMGDIIAYYRDYELNVSPYYNFRIVIAK